MLPAYERVEELSKVAADHLEAIASGGGVTTQGKDLPRADLEAVLRKAKLDAAMKKEIERLEEVVAQLRAEKHLP